MVGALFSLRCFDQSAAEYPAYCANFIVYGPSADDVTKAGENYLERYIYAYAPECRRIQKSGPHFVKPFVKTVQGDRPIDWDEVAETLKEQEAARSESEASCVFRTKVSEGYYEEHISFNELSHELQAKLMEETFPMNSLPVELQQEIAREVGLVEPDPNSNGEVPHGKCYFLGCAFNNDLHEREGDVVLIEASSLDQAADLCADAVGNESACTLTEWCCSVFSTEL